SALRRAGCHPTPPPAGGALAVLVAVTSGRAAARASVIARPLRIVARITSAAHLARGYVAAGEGSAFTRTSGRDGRRGPRFRPAVDGAARADADAVGEAARGGARAGGEPEGPAATGQQHRSGQARRDGVSVSGAVPADRCVAGDEARALLVHPQAA